MILEAPSSPPVPIRLSPRPSAERAGWEELCSTATPVASAAPCATPCVRAASSSTPTASRTSCRRSGAGCSSASGSSARRPAPRGRGRDRQLPAAGRADAWSSTPCARENARAPASAGERRARRRRVRSSPTGAAAPSDACWRASAAPLLRSLPRRCWARGAERRARCAAAGLAGRPLVAAIVARARGRAGR